jgi:signal peptidase I
MNSEKHRFRVPRYIITGLILGILLKLFVIDILHVSGCSMEPSIRDGSVLLVDKLAYGLVLPWSARLAVQWAQPKTGDIVIFLHNNRIVVKRCAATAGTRLEYLTDTGYSLRVGNKKVGLTEEQYFRMKNSRIVPDGYILALGDNYRESIDSRYYGFVPTYNILGKVAGR